MPSSGSGRTRASNSTKSYSTAGIFLFLPFRSNSAPNQKLCLSIKLPGHPMGLDYGNQARSLDKLPWKVRRESDWHVTPVLWHGEHTGCRGLGRFPLLLPQPAGPYSSLVNHCTQNFTALTATKVEWIPWFWCICWHPESVRVTYCIQEKDLVNLASLHSPIVL